MTAVQKAQVQAGLGAWRTLDGIAPGKNKKERTDCTELFGEGFEQFYVCANKDCMLSRV